MISWDPGTVEIIKAFIHEGVPAVTGIALAIITIKGNRKTRKHVDTTVDVTVEKVKDKVEETVRKTMTVKSETIAALLETNRKLGGSATAEIPRVHLEPGIPLAD